MDRLQDIRERLKTYSDQPKSQIRFFVVDFEEYAADVSYLLELLGQTRIWYYDAGSPESHAAVVEAARQQMGQVNIVVAYDEGLGVDETWWGTLAAIQKDKPKIGAPERALQRITEACQKAGIPAPPEAMRAYLKNSAPADPDGEDEPDKPIIVEAP